MEQRDPYQIFFFRHLHHPNRYFVKMFREDIANEYYRNVRHLNDYSKKNGYEFLEIEPPLVAIEINDNIIRNRFLNFLREKIAVRIMDENPDIAEWIGNNGWYEFTDINNTEKWLNDFYAYDNRRREELLKSDNIGIQISLF